MGLLITKKRSIAGYFLDATVSEQHVSEATITQNPVEFGAQITDHSIILPRRYVVAGRVSDTPLTGFIDNLLAVNDQWAAGNEETRSKSAWAVLNELKDNRELFTVESGMQRYENMMIKSLRAPQSAVNANVLDFTAEMIEVIIVNTQDVAVDFPEEGATAQQASENVDRGDVQTETVTPAREQTLFLKGANLIGVGN